MGRREALPKLWYAAILTPAAHQSVQSAGKSPDALHPAQGRRARLAGRRSLNLAEIDLIDAGT